MPKETVHTLLAHARELHRSLGVIYGRLEALAHRQRAKDLLDALAHHEHSLSQVLEETESHLTCELLNTWLADPPPESAWHAVRKLRFRPDMDAEEVIGLAASADQLLFDIYREICSLDLPEPVARVFRGLLDAVDAHRDELG